MTIVSRCNCYNQGPTADGRAGGIPFRLSRRLADGDGAVGAVIGSFLNVVVYRVPRRLARQEQ